MDWEQYSQSLAAVDAAYSAEQEFGGNGEGGTRYPVGWIPHHVLRQQLTDAYNASQNAPVNYASAQVAPAPAPTLPQFKPLTSTNFYIKAAPIDTIVFNDQLITIENMEELLYENIAGLELANISREDLINGQQVLYSPIANLASIYRLFNPNNIIATSSTSDTYFSRFSIDLILRGMNVPYIDDDGNLVIEIDNVSDNEEIHFQISSSGTIDSVEI